jgi:hypothetical protein
VTQVPRPAEPRSQIGEGVRRTLRGIPTEAKEKSMKVNVGGIDRMLRILVGLGLIALVFVVEGGLRWWGLVGILPLVTGTFRFCPAYTLLGLSTCPLEQKKA